MNFIYALIAVIVASTCINLVYGLIQHFTKHPDLALLDGCDSCQGECKCSKHFRRK